ncbi:MAG TPA: hypothetical protein VN158_07290 [Caulobacter sp.]|nr:hypothetical protein [Caulobacter sp.]
MRRMIFLGLALVAWSQAAASVAQPNDDNRVESFIRAANSRRDCSGYAAMANTVMAGRPAGHLGVRLSVATAICAARDGQFDLTNRLIDHASSKPPESGTEVMARYAFYYLIEQLADIPSAGASALTAAYRLPSLDRLPDRSIQSAEFLAMAMFAAGKDSIGIDQLERIDRRGALSVQADRRFASAWLIPAELIAVVDRPLKPLTPPLGEPWPRDLALLTRESDEAAVLSAARRLMQADLENTQPFGLAFGKTGSGGTGQRAWLVRRLVEDGRIDEAQEALDITAVRRDGKSGDMVFVPALVEVVQGLIRSDRPDEARRLLDWWATAQAEDKTEYVGFSREDNWTLWPPLALRACLRGDHTARLSPSDWRVSLACGDPEDRTATLLVAALSGGQRGETLQAVNLPPSHPVLGKADIEYRKRWDTLLARPDVAAAIDHYGRRLPPDLAWRLARAYPAF